MRQKVMVLAIIGLMGLARAGFGATFDVSAAGMTFTPPSRTFAASVK